MDYCSCGGPYEIKNGNLQCARCGLPSPKVRLVDGEFIPIDHNENKSEAKAMEKPEDKAMQMPEDKQIWPPEVKRQKRVIKKGIKARR